VEGNMFSMLSQSDLKDLFPSDFLARKKLWDFLNNFVEPNLISYYGAAWHSSLVYFLLWCCQCTCSRPYLPLILMQMRPDKNLELFFNLPRTMPFVILIYTCPDVSIQKTPIVLQNSRFYYYIIHEWFMYM